KIDVEPVFGFLKANLSFSRFSVRGKSKVENELAFALMAVNLRKYTAIIQNSNNHNSPKQKKKLRKQHFNVDSAIFLI
ncbi:MAG TPA: transposase, partial [Bacillota bacterium]|nr:transposase [Bacillota bacterium]